MNQFLVHESYHIDKNINNILIGFINDPSEFISKGNCLR